MKRKYPKEDKYAAQKAWNARNREKVNAYQRKVRLQDSERYKSYYRKSKLKLIYGLSESAFELLKNKQKGKCAICLERDAICIDHDHLNGRIRGLLCHSCNKGLGMFRDEIRLLQYAIHYLDTTKS